MGEDSELALVTNVPLLVCLPGYGVQVRLKLRSNVLFLSSERTRYRIAHDKMIAVVLNQGLHMPRTERRRKLPDRPVDGHLLLDRAAEYKCF